MMLARVVQLRYSKAGISSLPPSAQVAQPLGSTSISQCGLDPHNSSQEQPCSCMEPGRLSNHDPVLLYMQQLDEHKKRCELTGRYAEAAAAAARIQDLKSAQGQRMHGELVSMQHRELSHLQQTYQQETQAFDQQWAMRIAACEQGVAAQLTGLRAAHEAQLAAFVVDAETRRPTKPQHSAEYLDNRKTEEQLVKQGQYQRAHQLKVAADALYLSELAATQAAWDAEAELRRRKLIAKQQGEVEVLLQRAGRGRNELELRRLNEAEKRHNRFRARVQELDAMHRLESVHLGAFLDGGQAGKYAPLRDTTIKKKRELLGL
eukprot:GHRR01019488.1.p1 GENE.GHRR01019488.1~~GHRR01019488.1.p1  ORF type:complete len:319 (+),score=95.94 GHRR01019488.1:970-1926(+)